MITALKSVLAVLLLVGLVALGVGIAIAILGLGIILAQVFVVATLATMLFGIVFWAVGLILKPFRIAYGRICRSFKKNIMAPVAA